MASALETLGLTQEQVAKVEVASIREGFETLPSGIYEGNIVTVGTFTTDSGAIQFKIVVRIKDEKARDGYRELTKYGNFRKKDGSVNEFGQRDIIGALEATKMDLAEIKTQTIKEKCYATERDFNNFIGVNKAPVTIFVRQVLEEGAQYEDQNEIEGIFDIEGKNSKGEDQTEAFMKKIEKTPVLKRKAKNNNTATATNKPATGASKVVSRL